MAKSKKIKKDIKAGIMAQLSIIEKYLENGNYEKATYHVTDIIDRLSTKMITVTQTVEETPMINFVCKTFEDMVAANID